MNVLTINSFFIFLNVNEQFYEDKIAKNSKLKMMNAVFFLSCPKLACILHSFVSRYLVDDATFTFVTLQRTLSLPVRVSIQQCNAMHQGSRFCLRR